MPSYWETYPNFDHNEHNGVQEEFGRLAAMRGWEKGGRRYRKEWDLCISSEGQKHLGHSTSSLPAWQALCREVGVREARIPTSIKQCKSRLKTSVFINIVDLIDCRRTGRQVQRHASKDALRKYTKRTEKIYPKKLAKENGFLTALLIVMS